MSVKIENNFHQNYAKGLYYSRLRENLFIIAIFIVMLEYQLSFVHTFFIDRIIKIVAFSVLILFFKNIRDNMKRIHIQKINAMYIILLLLMIFSTITNLSLDMIAHLVRYSLLILFVLFLLNKVHPNYFSDMIIKYPLFIGAVLSLNSITLWLLVYFDFEPDWSYIVSERFSRISEFSYLWGDMVYATKSYMRACGFFETPNRFGNFLLFPVFVSFGYFVITKRLVYLCVCILCSVVIGLTLALTILLASIATISINIFFHTVSNNRGLRRHPFLVGIVSLLLALVAMMGVMKYYSAQHSESGSVVFRGGQYETIFYSFVISANDLVPDINKPFGNGLAYTRDGKYYTAQFGFVRWIIYLGYPGAIFFIVFIAYMFKVHVFPVLLSKERRIERYVALAFVAQTMCDFEEGSWFSTNYLFTTAILVLLKDYTFKERKRKKQFKGVPYTTLPGC